MSLNKKHKKVEIKAFEKDISKWSVTQNHKPKIRGSTYKTKTENNRESRLKVKFLNTSPRKAEIGPRLVVYTRNISPIRKH